MDFKLDSTPFAEEIAELLIEQELALHPEMVAQKHLMLEGKIGDLKNIIDSQFQEIMTDIQTACEYLSKWMENEPLVKKDRLKEEFKRAQQILNSEEFKDFILSSLEYSEECDATLQQLFGISDQTLEEIYAIAHNLQKKEGDYSTSKALFRFLTILNPTLEDLWIGFGFSLMHLDQFTESYFCFDYARLLNPGSPAPLYFSTICALLEKEPDKADAYFEAGIRLAKTEEWQKRFQEIEQKRRSQ